MNPPLLVVDDEPMVREVLSETLKREGYQVITANDGFEALEQLTRTQFAVILSDNNMPGMRGLDLLGKAREIQPHASRILITGVVDLDTVLEAINRGELYRFIVKPWVREELLATLRNGVQRYELTSQNAALLEETRTLNQQLGKANQSLELQLQRELAQNQQLERLNEALSGNLQRSVELCVKTVQTFYPTLGSRARRIFQICRQLGEAVKLDRGSQAALEVAAQLHDIGLIGVPRDLIKRWQRNPEVLSDAERRLIQQHPIWGQELVGFMDSLEAVGSIIRAHHERFDGKGFPDQLAGELIPWPARLLAVAIRYVDLVEEGDLSASLTLKQLAGSVLDPEAVRVFSRIHPTEHLPRGQREVLLTELKPGMVLARGVYTSNGMLLMPEGQALSHGFINKLLNHHGVNPIRHSLLVYC